mgnify:CR=1 FL=1
MAGQLVKESSYIIEQNTKDMAKGEEKGMHAGLLDRLRLTDGRIEAMAQGTYSFMRINSCTTALSVDSISRIASSVMPSAFSACRITLVIAILDQIPRGSVSAMPVNPW